MTKKEIQTHLASLFTTSKRENGDEYIHYNNSCMYKTDPAHDVYEAVSDAAYGSGLTHDFSYEISSRAAAILAEHDWTDDDADMSEAIDAVVPIYTDGLMKMYLANWDIIDQANNETGTPTVYDSVAAARIGWYCAIENMCREISSRLNGLVK